MKASKTAAHKPYSFVQERLFGFWRDLFSRWANRRAPRGDRFRLGAQSVYVFVSGSGLLFLFFLAVAFLVGVNYGNNLALGVFFYLLAVGLVCVVVTYAQLFALQIRLEDVSLAPASGLIWARIGLKNTQSKAVRQVELAFDQNIDAAMAALDASDRLWFERCQKVTVAELDGETVVYLPVFAPRRGVVSLPRLVIKSRYPLGIVQAWSYGFFAQSAFVYPRPKAFTDFADARQTAASAASTFYQKGQEDFDGLDQYKEGESWARVSWAHAARGMGMLSKQFGDPVGDARVLDYERMPSLLREDKLSELSYLLSKQGDAAFVLRLPSGDIGQGSGADFVKACLIRLAKEP